MSRLIIVGVSCVLLGTPLLAASKWNRVDADHFIVVGDVGPRELSTLALRFEQFREVLTRLLPDARWTMSAPTEVMVFDSDRSFTPYKILGPTGKPAGNVGAFYIGGRYLNFIAITLARDDRSLPLVYKAYAYQLLNDNASTMPLWAMRGVSEFYGTFKLAANQQGADIGHVPDYHLQRLVTGFIPLRDLFAATESSRAYVSDRQLFDAMSWAVVHYLLMEKPDGRDALGEVLGPREGGRAARSAFWEGPNVEALDKEVRGYVTRRLYKFRQVTFDDRLASRKPDRLSVMSEGNTMAHLSALLAAENRLSEAETLATSALKLDATSAMAHATMGTIRQRQSRLGEAWPAYQRAAALGGDDFNTQYYVSMLPIQEYAGDGAVTDLNRSRLEGARAALIKTVALDPDSAAAQGALGWAYLALGGSDVEARHALTRAVELAPANQQYRLWLAEAAIRQRDAAAARRAIGEMSARADTPGLVASARRLLGAVSKLEEPRQVTAVSDAQTGVPNAPTAVPNAPAASPNWPPRHAIRPGPDVTMPKLIREAKPNYTKAALDARIHGSVWIECVVETDGSVGDAIVSRSLDPTLGLDDEAIKAVKQWQFVAGLRSGVPVAVVVSIEMTFTLKQH